MSKSTPARTAHQSILSSIRDQCRDTALSLSFSISRLKEVGQPDAARRLQNVSISLSRIAQELEADHE